MTDQHHPITPPPELVQQWEEDWHHIKVNIELELYIATRAAQWGADQEMEACCEAIKDRRWFVDPTFRLAELRASRRPKPPSLKEQALAAAAELEGFKGVDTIRRALEALPDDL